MPAFSRCFLPLNCSVRLCCSSLWARDKLTELAKLYVAVLSALSLNMLQCMPLPQSRKALVLKKKYAVFIYVMLETLSCAWKLLGSLIFRTGTWKEYITRHHLGRWSNGRWHTFVLIQDGWVVYGDYMHIAFFVTECIGCRLHNGARDVLTEIPHQLMQWCALHEPFWWPLISKEVFCVTLHLHKRCVRNWVCMVGRIIMNLVQSAMSPMCPALKGWLCVCGIDCVSLHF